MTEKPTLAQYSVKLSAELSEGMNVSKDSVAEVITETFDGMNFDALDVGWDIVAMSYEGSGKGKPLGFLVNIETAEIPTEKLEDPEFDWEEVGEQLLETLQDSVSVYCEANEQDSMYDIMGEGFQVELGEKRVI